MNLYKLMLENEHLMSSITITEDDTVYAPIDDAIKCAYDFRVSLISDTLLSSVREHPQLTGEEICQVIKDYHQIMFDLAAFRNDICLSLRINIFPVKEILIDRLQHFSPYDLYSL